MWIWEVSVCLSLPSLKMLFIVYFGHLFLFPFCSLLLSIPHKLKRDSVARKGETASEVKISDKVITAEILILFTYFYWILFIFKKNLIVDRIERVTGRKARGLQMEEIGCKCQTFFISLKRQEETSDILFSPSLYKFKRRFLLKYCVAIITPGFTWS